MDEKRIITVIGKSDTGKTTFIKYVYEKLINDGAELIFYKKTGRFYDDFYALVYWKEMPIALCSIGDKSAKSDCEFDKGLTIKNKKLAYIQRGIEMAIRFHSKFLINALNEDEISENEYKKLLKEYQIADYEPFKLTVVKGEAYSALAARESDYNKLLTKISLL